MLTTLPCSAPVLYAIFFAIVMIFVGVITRIENPITFSVLHFLHEIKNNPFTACILTTVALFTLYVPLRCMSKQTAELIAVAVLT